MMWRDHSGRTLADYDRPSVAVDVALLTVVDDGLAVLLHERTGEHETGRWALPGTFLHVDETLAEAALRALRDKAGVTGHRPDQLGVLDRVDRDSRGRVLSVAHVDLVPAETLLTGGDGLRLAPVTELADASLPFDHDEIVARAVRWARDLHRLDPDPRGLLGAEFTLLELQRLHEAVAGTEFQKDTFRRIMIGGLDETGALSRGGVGKPARLFRRA
ncbi:NUDIX hydrolase [Pseudonocardia sulfidoxydans NBRC 16205]|uniref:NUDIX hydrolase n=1 Tax=Pseudonocardia sulfidoxydans NBRC 16205 TaxID=1223511 RepID=A0A511DGH9_9PSEU|nr:NUDIX domain-containing protein [Pseudonocardia sulfidoxydans]GEL23882.1 NUDIX hydrolase [Pseudonocardia sulfidoxydans NBRC 16205]